MSLPPLRSALYVPGDRPDRFEKALASEADAVILDLEDAVAPARKAAARTAAAALVRSPPPKPLFVRVNGLGSGLLPADVEALAGGILNGIRLPKVEGADDVDAAARLLDAAGFDVPVWPMIESARGLEHAYEIASSGRAAGISLGEADLQASLRAQEDEGLDYARARCVAAARAAGLPSPMQAVFRSVRDEDGLRRSTERGKRLGFFGRSALHPAQIATINQVFTPTDEEVAGARELTAALEGAMTDASGTAVLADGRFVDRAVAEHARDVVELAARLAQPRR